MNKKSREKCDLERKTERKISKKEFVKWSKGRPITSKMRDRCPRGDWLIWIYARQREERYDEDKQLMLAVCRCVGKVLKFAPKNLALTLTKSVKGVRAWCNGHTRMKDIEEALLATCALDDEYKTDVTCAVASLGDAAYSNASICSFDEDCLEAGEDDYRHPLAAISVGNNQEALKAYRVGIKNAVYYAARVCGGHVEMCRTIRSVL